MKRIAVGVLALALLGGGAWWWQTARHGGAGASPAPARAAVQYTCAMHPQIIRDRPGSCPICGMNLVPMERRSETGHPAPSAGEGVANHAAVVIPSERRQLIGVTTGVVAERALASSIRTVGRVAYDPDLYRVQEEYLAVTEDLRESVAFRLRLLGMSDAEVRALREAGGADGALLISEGKAAGRAWVYASVYEGDQDLVRPGVAAAITAPAVPGLALRGVVKGVTPVLSETTRTARARVLVTGAGVERLRPEMYVEVVLEIGIGRRLAVPESAVLDSGAARLVFVDEGHGRLVPRTVRLGRKAGGWYEVLDGLRAGEVVVTSGNFLVDSESRLRAVAGHD